MITEEKTFLPEETQVVFLHGLESTAKSDKADWLKKHFNTWVPEIDYKNPHEFQDIYNQIMTRRPRLIVGSSMGGWFAYAISTLTGIRTLLLNPAVQGRSMEPKGVNLGRIPANHVVILGKNDDVIDPKKTEQWLSKYGIGTFDYHYENIGHRTPTNIMNKHIDRAINEEWSTESPGNEPDLSFLPESVIDLLRQNAFASRPPESGSWTVENDTEIPHVINAQKGLSTDEMSFAKRVAKSPVDEFYTYLITRGYRIKKSEIENIWDDPRDMEMISKMKDVFKRDRPYWISPDIDYIPGTGSDSYSFPSGHAYGAWKIALTLSKKFPHLRNSLETLADRISHSRVYAGVHFPMDIKFGKEIALISEHIIK